MPGFSPPPVRTAETPSGRHRYRQNWRGQLVLQIEMVWSETWQSRPIDGPKSERTVERSQWRDAMVSDLVETPSGRFSLQLPGRDENG